MAMDPASAAEARERVAKWIEETRQVFGLLPDLMAGYRYLHGNDLTFLGTAFGDLHPNGVKMHHAEANLKIGF